MDCVILPPIRKFKARMAELVDAADSKSAVRKDVQVRFLFRAQSNYLLALALRLFILNVGLYCTISMKIDHLKFSSLPFVTFHSLTHSIEVLTNRILISF